jgi:hypothetical protein
MAGGIEFDFSEIQTLAADLGKVPANAGRHIVAAVEETAGDIKTDWRGKLDGARFLPGAAKSISYDLGSSGQSLIREALNSGAGELANAVTAEIGAKLGGQGSLVGIVEYGSPTLAPRGYGAAALKENEQKFAERLAKATLEAERELSIS